MLLRFHDRMDDWMNVCWVEGLRQYFHVSAGQVEWVDGGSGQQTNRHGAVCAQGDRYTSLNKQTNKQ